LEEISKAKYLKFLIDYIIVCGAYYAENFANEGIRHFQKLVPDSLPNVGYPDEFDQVVRYVYRIPNEFCPKEVRMAVIKLFRTSFSRFKIGPSVRGEAHDKFQRLMADCPKLPVDLVVGLAETCEKIVKLCTEATPSLSTQTKDLVPLVLPSGMQSPPGTLFAPRNDIRRPSASPARDPRLHV
jgi:hypothetical protein